MRAILLHAALFSVTRQLAEPVLLGPTTAQERGASWASLGSTTAWDKADCWEGLCTGTGGNDLKNQKPVSTDNSPSREKHISVAI